MWLVSRKDGRVDIDFCINDALRYFGGFNAPTFGVPFVALCLRWDLAFGNDPTNTKLWRKAHEILVNKNLHINLVIVLKDSQRRRVPNRRKIEVDDEGG